MDPSINLPDPRGFREEDSSKAFEIQRSGPGILSIQVTPGSGFIVQPWVPDKETTTGEGGQSPPPPPPPPLPPVRVRIATRHPRSGTPSADEIYGVNHSGAGAPEDLKEAGVTVCGRKGGMRSRGTTGRWMPPTEAVDWYFEVKPDNVSGGVSSFDAFVQVHGWPCTVK